MKDIPEKKRSYPIYKYIGYYKTRHEALDALAQFNLAPYEEYSNGMTLQQLFDEWIKARTGKISPSTLASYRRAFQLSEPLLNRQIEGLKLADFQLVAEESGKNEPVLHRWKVVIGQMYEFAVRNELLPQEKRDMIRYIDISFSENPNKLQRTNFSREEIETLWQHSENRAVKSILILLYTGLRISEFLALKKDDVDLQRRAFKVTASKTSAGVREVPIAEKTVPLWEYLLAQPGEEVFPAERGKKYIYQNYLAYIWQPVMKTLGFSHTIHETRHTCISLLTEAGVDARLIKQIVGHASQDVTEGIYTHLAFEKKKNAIDKL